MKIACLGNMNNIIAPTAQYLAQQGHVVDLFLLYEYDHFHPNADYYDETTIQFNIIKTGFQFGEVANIEDTILTSFFLGYDFYIATDYGPAMLAKINIKTDIFVWAGSDLLEWPFYKSKFTIPKIWEIEKIKTAFYQKKGIQYCAAMPMSPNNSNITKAIKKTKSKATIFPALPFLNYSIIDENYIKQTKYIHLISELKNQYDKIFIQHSRQWWKNAPKEHYKGNDRLITAFANLIHKNSDKNPLLILLEYGQNVNESKELIAELNIETNIYWLPISLRKDLIGLMHYCDAGIAETGDESWLLYCANAEMLAAEIPVIAYRKDELYPKEYLFSILNAQHEMDIENQLLNVYSNYKIIHENCLTNKTWLLQKNYTEPLNMVCKLIKNKKQSETKLRYSIQKYLLEIKCKFIWITNSVFLRLKIQ